VWPSSAEELFQVQEALDKEWREQVRWCGSRDGLELRVGGVFVASERREADPGRGAAGDPAWAAAVVTVGSRLLEGVSMEDRFDAPYEPGLLALREGRLLQAILERLPHGPPDVLLVNATGRDHPRRAGLALHLGAVCGLPTIGVTDRPLIATGDPLVLEGEVVAYWVRTVGKVRPVVVHAGWQTDAETARDIVLRLPNVSRTPEPLRQARRLARTLRAESSG
jgi:deoxyribonuclease V